MTKKSKRTVAVLAAVVIIGAGSALWAQRAAPQPAQTTVSQTAESTTAAPTQHTPVYSAEFDKKLIAHPWFYVSPDAGDLTVNYTFFGKEKCERVLTESDGTEQKEPAQYIIDGDTATLQSDTAKMTVQETPSKDVLVYRYAMKQEDFFEEGILLNIAQPDYHSMAAADFLGNTQWHSDFYQTDEIPFGAPEENYVFGTVNKADGTAQACGVFALSDTVYSLFFEEETGNPTHIYLERTDDDTVLRAYILERKTYEEHAVYHLEEWHRVK